MKRICIIGQPSMNNQIHYLQMELSSRIKDYEIITYDSIDEDISLNELKSMDAKLWMDSDHVCLIVDPETITDGTLAVYYIELQQMISNSWRQLHTKFRNEVDINKMVHDIHDYTHLEY